MKRGLLITTLVAVAAIAAAVPYWFGVEAERIYNEQVSALDAGKRITVEQNVFRRGWFRSHAETLLYIDGIGAEVLARHTIEHGPIPASNVLHHLVSLSPVQALIRSRLSVQAEPAAEDAPVGTLLTRVNLNGTTHTRMQLPAATLRLDQSGELSWREVSGDVDFSPRDAVWRGRITSDGADWRHGEAAVTLGPLTLNFVSFQGSTGLALGNSSLETESMRAWLPGLEQDVTARALKMDSTAKERGDRVDYSLAGSLAYAGHAELDIAEGSWKLVASGLDRDSLTRLSTMEAGAALPLNDLLGSVTRGNASLDAEFDFTTKSGPFSARASAALAGDGNGANPLMMLGALQGRVSLDMPSGVVELAARSVLTREMEQTPELTATLNDEEKQRRLAAAVPGRIQSWVDHNTLVRDGDRYRFSMALDQGSIQVNGKPFDLTSLLR